jgi:hypothetical protein
MTDDIVQRLRQAYHLADVAPDHILRRACEEIERLRAELAQQRCPYIRSSGTGEQATNWCALNGPSDHREAMRMALEALEMSYCYVKAEADAFHAAMAGYRPHKHAALDRDVQETASAISALRAALGGS